MCWATRYQAKKRPSNCALWIVQHSCAIHCNLQQLFHSLQCSTPVWDTHLHQGQSHVASGHNRPAWDGWSGRLERQRWQIRNQGRRSSAPDFDIFPLLQDHQMRSGNKAGSQFCFGNSSFSRVGQRLNNGYNSDCNWDDDYDDDNVKGDNNAMMENLIMIMLIFITIWIEGVTKMRTRVTEWQW